ncbi:MAG: nitrophenyl compound nitroreductase subunit ArsF family protein [bacterium]
MKSKTAVTIILLIFVAASAVYLIYNEAFRKPVGEKNPVTGPRGVSDIALVVYFFHGTARCRSCKIIEAFGKVALADGFPEELKSGKIVWRDINLDRPENRHFAQDYQIVSISLVMVDMENGEQKRWKNLEEVWGLLNDKGKFTNYVQREVRAWL